ncbi:MAG: TPR end-of-group domain-containing protein, partial [Pyrinomonadaceae bacterium]
LEQFHEALISNPEEPHVLFAIAATLTRMSDRQEALKTLERAIELLPSLRSRAQHDQDLLALRNDPEFERIVFTYR